MHTQIGRLALAGLLIGCTGTLDGGAPVIGAWGSDDFDLIATPGGVVLNSGCYVVKFPLQSPLAYGDSFAVAGTVTSSSWSAEVGQQWRLKGIARGDTVAATVSFLGVVTPENPSPTWLTPVAVAFAGPPRTDRIHVCAL